MSSKYIKIVEIEKEIKFLQEKISKLEAEKLRLENSITVQLTDLIIEYQKESSVFVYKSYESKQYKRILGGDGRSSPWDEDRIGNCLLVTIASKVFVSDDDLKKFEEYLKIIRTHDVECIFLNGYQLD